MNVVMADKPIPENPEFVDVFKQMGVDIVHLGEFHYTAHPTGPDDQRLSELNALFEQCRRLSDTGFLLLPGEEPNEFLGGHWMAIFPKPVYWIMSREEGKPFLTGDTTYGKIYRIKDKKEMQRLLELENGRAWTFPLNFINIVSGDGEKVFKERIALDDTQAFGAKEFHFSVNLSGRKWVRVEVWDVAVNGAFTQTVYLQ